MKRFRTILVLGTAISGSLALVSAAAAQQAPGASAPASGTTPPAKAADTTQVQEVVVTGRGRNERLQNVPIAETAFTSQQIEQAQIKEVGDFINLTPNMTIVQSQDVGLALVNIRGVTQVRNSESPVATVVDGVEEIAPAQFAQELFDLQSIEVLKGPQGALYGRDAEGGAIIINTKQPTNTLDGHLQLGGGSGGEFDAQGVASGPIIKDQLYFRVGVNYVDREGYFENIYLNKKQDPYKDTAVQALLKWTPSDRFDADLHYAHGQTDAGAINFHYEGAGLLPNGLLNPANPFGGTPNVPNNNANYYSTDFNSEYIGFDNRTIDEVSARLSYDLGFATAQSVTAFNHITEINGGNALPYGNIPADDPTQNQYTDTTGTSEEIRLTSRTDQRFRWVIGAYYLDTTEFISTANGINEGLGLPHVERVPLGAGSVSPTTSFFGDTNHNVSYAGFADIDYDILQNLQFSAGIRYDTEDAMQYVSVYNSGGNPGTTNKTNFHLAQPKFTLTYKPISNVTTYASWGVGFRSGEFNQNGTAALGRAGGLNGISDVVPQESATTTEVGFKTTWWDHRITFNGDVFHTDVQNQQYFVFLGAVGAQILVPINKVSLNGGELEGQIRVLPGLDLYSALGITQSRVDSYAVNPADVGKWAPYVPEVTFNAGAQYKYDFTDRYSLTSRIDYRLLGKQYWDPENSTARNAVNLLGLTATLEDKVLHLKGILSADNVTNTKYNVEYVDGGFVQPAPGTVIRGTLRYDF